MLQKYNYPAIAKPFSNPINPYLCQCANGMAWKGSTNLLLTN